jgi:hypothetical protein
LFSAVCALSWCDPRCVRCSRCASSSPILNRPDLPWALHGQNQLSASSYHNAPPAPRHTRLLYPPHRNLTLLFRNTLDLALARPPFAASRPSQPSARPPVNLHHGQPWCRRFSPTAAANTSRPSPGHTAPAVSQCELLANKLRLEHHLDVQPQLRPKPYTLLLPLPPRVRPLGHVPVWNQPLLL